MRIKTLPLLLLLALTACGSDNESNGGGYNSTANNANSNFANINHFTHRMEFPKLKDGANVILVHTLSSGEVNYSVEYDTQKKSTRWSCYELYGSNRETHTQRWNAGEGEDQYPQNPLLDKQYRWESDPFWRSGYDHGHLCPSADRLNSLEANKQTFYLTNMMPQVNGFNAKVWANMEAWVRNLIKTTSKDTIFVVKGGTIDNASQYTTLARTGGDMIVPKYYYMAVLMHNNQGYKAMGFWIEHKASNATDLSPYVVNIGRLEQLTGVDFFCNLPDDTENHVENLPLEQVKRAWGFQ